MNETKMKRSLYLTKTFLFSLLLYLSVVYQPIVNCIYEGKISKDDLTALLVGTFGFLGVSGSRARVNDDIRASAREGVPVGLVGTGIPSNKA
jgi:hypothetical protein